MSNAIILFDGVCNLCTGSVRFIIDRDPQGYFQFASLQSAIGQQLLQPHGLTAAPLNSIILLENGQLYTQSDAALRIARRLTGLWPLLRLGRLVPRPLRDGLYGWIAANRYRWFGQAESCLIPTPALRRRFLG